MKLFIVAAILGLALVGACSDSTPATSIDAAIADLSSELDATSDAPGPDLLQPDAAHPDAALPDAALPDAALPDAALPDAALPDAALPDAALPDAALPDAPVADAPVADAPVDDSPQTDAPQPDSGVGIPGTWVTIPPAGTSLPVTFSMGAPTGENCREPVSSKETQHQVTLTHAFEISAYEVTQAEFEALMGYNPAYFASCGEDCPVERLNWHEAAAYCNALSSLAGLTECYSCGGGDASVTCSEATAYSGENIYDCPGYRLPTEAEFEYAYRAGSSTPFYPSAANDGSITNCTSSDPNADQIGWYNQNAGSTTQPKGLKAPNAWGLYDMAGNVFEWCHDWYQIDLGSLAVIDPWGAASGSERVVRCGSWLGFPVTLRAAYRIGLAPSTQYASHGFRPCRTINP